MAMACETLTFAQAKRELPRELELSLSRHGFQTPRAEFDEGEITIVVHNRTRRPQLRLKLDKNLRNQTNPSGPQSELVADGNLRRADGVPWIRRVNLQAGSYQLIDQESGSTLAIEVRAKR